MEKEQLALRLGQLLPGAEINASKEVVEITTDPSAWHATASLLANDSQLRFDYLHNLYSVDWQTDFMMIAHLDSTLEGHSVVLKTRIPDHDQPVIESVSDIWITANYQEREIYDLMGIRFSNHPDLRRLFLEDGWGFPLRKDYKDDINFIER